MKTRIETLVENIYDWADARGILAGKVSTQGAKLISEMGELIDATIKNDTDAVADALGDMSVVMVSLTTLALGFKDREVAIDELTTFLSEAIKYGVVSVSDIFEFSYLITLNVKNLINNFNITGSVRLLFAYINTFAVQKNIDLLDCIDAAWLEIKDRKGKTLPNGNFVKEV